MVYYYFIMNHLEECKKTETRTPGPKLDKYDIDISNTDSTDLD